LMTYPRTKPRGSSVSSRASSAALIASGLVLFVLTLAVNLIARYVILRSGTQERSSV
jgi:ABC-type phosphate transport system permease subunit